MLICFHIRYVCFCNKMLSSYNTHYMALHPRHFPYRKSLLTPSLDPCGSLEVLKFPTRVLISEY